MALIQITRELTPDVIRAPDALFNREVTGADIDEVGLRAIKDLDGATPVTMSESPNSFFQTSKGVIPLSQISSSTKTILLALCRLRRPDATWIINWDSAEPAAKEFLARHLHNVEMDVIPFPLYCSSLDYFGDFAFRPWYLYNGSTEPTTLSAIFGESANRYTLSIDEMDLNINFRLRTRVTTVYSKDTDTKQILGLMKSLYELRDTESETLVVTDRQLFAYAGISEEPVIILNKIEEYANAESLNELVNVHRPDAHFIIFVRGEVKLPVTAYSIAKLNIIKTDNCVNATLEYLLDGKD